MTAPAVGATTGFSFFVPAVPRGKGRPRARGIVTADGRASVRAFTDPRTRSAEALVVWGWDAAGRPRVAERVALRVTVDVLLERPMAQYRRDGALTKAGLEAPHPAGRPDLDNVVKLVLDALNGLAFLDDALVCELAASKRWVAARGDQTGYRIGVWRL